MQIHFFFPPEDGETEVTGFMKGLMNSQSFIFCFMCAPGSSTLALRSEPAALSSCATSSVPVHLGLTKHV